MEEVMRVYVESLVTAIEEVQEIFSDIKKAITKVFK
jgi:hypothetical protein